MESNEDERESDGDEDGDEGGCEGGCGRNMDDSGRRANADEKQ